MSASEQEPSSVTTQVSSNPKYLQDQLATLVNVQSPLNDTTIIKRDHLGNQEQFYCNSALLSCSSPVFKSMLTNENFEECKTRKIFIPAVRRETGKEQAHGLAEEELEEECFVPSETFLEFIRFCTCAQCHLSEENVVTLLNLAQKYSVYGLLDCCIKYLTDHFILKGGDESMVNWAILLEVLTIARSCQVPLLIESCEKLVRYSTRKLLDEQMIEGIDNRTFDPAKVKVRKDITLSHWYAFLQCPEMLISEEEVFAYVKQWIEQQGQDNLIIEEIRALIQAVRLPTCGQDYLQNTVFPFLSKIQDEELMQYYRDALKYSRACKDLTREQIVELEDQYPTNYKSRKTTCIFGFGNSEKSYRGFRLITWTEFTVTLYDEMKGYYEAFGGYLNLEYGSSPPYQSGNCCFKVGEITGHVAIKSNPIYPWDMTTKTQNCNGTYESERYKFSHGGAELSKLPDPQNFDQYVGCTHSTNPGIFVSL